MFIVTVINTEFGISIGEQWIYSDFNQCVKKVKKLLWKLRRVQCLESVISAECGYIGDDWAIIIGQAESED